MKGCELVALSLISAPMFAMIGCVAVFQDNQTTTIVSLLSSLIFAAYIARLYFQREKK